MYGESVLPSILKSDVAANDSDKIWVVPAGKVWQVVHVYVSYASTATVGNRQVTLGIYTNTAGAPSVLVGQFPAPDVQVASQTETYHFVAGVGNVVEPVAGTHYIGIPEHLWVQNPYIIRVWDSAGIAAAADDMTVHMWVNERSER